MVSRKAAKDAKKKSMVAREAAKDAKNRGSMERGDPFGRLRVFA